MGTRWEKDSLLSSLLGFPNIWVYETHDGSSSIPQSCRNKHIFLGFNWRVTWSYRRPLTSDVATPPSPQLCICSKTNSKLRSFSTVTGQNGTAIAQAPPPPPPPPIQPARRGHSRLPVWRITVDFKWWFGRAAQTWSPQIEHLFMSNAAFNNKAIANIG